MRIAARLLAVGLAIAAGLSSPAIAQSAPPPGPAPGATGAAAAAGARPYAGQHTRAITTLSAEDIQALLAGQGWGLAKPAELNGFPGPLHVLELDKELALTPQQRLRVQASFERMKRRAVVLGPRYVEAERALDQAFRSGRVDTRVLAQRLRAAEQARARLRAVHLEAHLETTPVLTPEQRKRYAELRGYGSGEGHPHHPGHHHGRH